MRTSVKAYAKINLFLDITGTLPNGYHSLFTVMRPIDIYDELEITAGEGSGITVYCDEPRIPLDEKNIAHRAAETFLSATGTAARISVAIKKNIPLEAGLGGSSTDGAAVLAALNSMYGEPLSFDELLKLGASLGADVPFCLYGKTALCTGIGEKITPVECPDDHVIAIVKPELSCNTGEAYKRYDRSPLPPSSNGEAFLKALPLGAEKWGGLVYNVFEKLYNSPGITEITNTLLENGAAAASLTGSGSAVFGAFKDTYSAERALEKINAPYKRTAKPR